MVGSGSAASGSASERMRKTSTDETVDSSPHKGPCPQSASFGMFKLGLVNGHLVDV